MEKLTIINLYFIKHRFQKENFQSTRHKFIHKEKKVMHSAPQLIDQERISNYLHFPSMMFHILKLMSTFQMWESSKEILIFQKKEWLQSPAFTQLGIPNSSNNKIMTFPNWRHQNKWSWRLLKQKCLHNIFLKINILL